MKIETLHVGMKVKHPQYGEGVVKSINEHTAEIVFNEGTRTVEPLSSGVTPCEPMAALSGLDIPLQLLIQQTLDAAMQKLGLEKPGSVVEQLGARWIKGKIVLHPSDPTQQTKEVPVDVFFHKIVMMRNNLRVLEQKINGHPQLSDSEKVEMQQYITRCYGSMTTFNILFKNKEDQFTGASS